MATDHGSTHVQRSSTSRLVVSWLMRGSTAVHSEQARREADAMGVWHTQAMNRALTFALFITLHAAFHFTTVYNMEIIIDILSNRTSIPETCVIRIEMGMVPGLCAWECPDEPPFMHSCKGGTSLFTLDYLDVTHVLRDFVIAELEMDPSLLHRDFKRLDKKLTNYVDMVRTSYIDQMISRRGFSESR